MAGPLPGWTVLKDASSSSRHSDESSQDIRDEIKITPPVRKRKLGASISDDESPSGPRRPKKPRPTNVIARQSGAGPSIARAKPPPSTSAKRPEPPGSISTALSQSAAKKKKRKIVSPIEGPVTEASAASAAVRRPRHSDVLPPRPPVKQAGKRRVSDKAPATVAADPSTTGKKPDLSRRPLVAAAALKPKRKERQPSVIVLSDDDEPVSAPVKSSQVKVPLAAKRPRKSAPSKLSSEVIEISDDDDNDIPPKPPAVRKPPPSQAKIPFKQDRHEIVILDSDDEEPRVASAPRAPVTKTEATTSGDNQQDTAPDAEPEFEAPANGFDLDEWLDFGDAAPVETMPGPGDEPAPPPPESPPAIDFPMHVDDSANRDNDGVPPEQPSSAQEPAPLPSSPSPVSNLEISANEDELVIPPSGRNSPPIVDFVTQGELAAPSTESPSVTSMDLQTFQPTLQDQMLDPVPSVSQARETGPRSSPEGEESGSVAVSDDPSSSDEVPASASDTLREEDARLSLSVNSQLRISNEPVVEQTQGVAPLTRVPTLDLKALCTPKARKKKHNGRKIVMSPEQLFSPRKSDFHRRSSVLPPESPLAVGVPKNDDTNDEHPNLLATNSTRPSESTFHKTDDLLHRGSSQVNPEDAEVSAAPDPPLKSSNSSAERLHWKSLFSGPDGFYKGVFPESRRASKQLVGPSAVGKARASLPIIGSAVKAPSSPTDMPSSPHAIASSGVDGGHDVPISSGPLEVDVTTNLPESGMSRVAARSGSPKDHVMDQDAAESPSSPQIRRLSPNPPDAMEVDAVASLPVPMEDVGSSEPLAPIAAPMPLSVVSSDQAVDMVAAQPLSAQNLEQLEALPSSPSRPELESPTLRTPIHAPSPVPGRMKTVHESPVRRQRANVPQASSVGLTLTEALNAAYASQRIRNVIDLTSDTESVRGDDALGSPKATSVPSSSPLRGSPVMRPLSSNRKHSTTTTTPAPGVTVPGHAMPSSSHASIPLGPLSQSKQNRSLDDIRALRRNSLRTTSGSLPSPTGSNSIASMEQDRRSPVPGLAIDITPSQRSLPRRSGLPRFPSFSQSGANRLASTIALPVNAATATHTTLDDDSLPLSASSREPAPEEVMSGLEDEEEQECIGILAYPDTPDVEIPEQLEEDAPITSRTRSRLRSHASSETSIAPDHSRKPSRRSSSSASSSVGPIDLVLNRRTEPRVQIRNGSDDTIDVYDALCAEHGFEMQTWSKTRELLVSEFAPLCQLAEDIPHELEDMINTLPLFARRANNMQVTLFEAAIANNTADDEPHAPPIHIINDVDDELTPPYEFHYSNLMWHGQDVPKPNIEDLKGCDCFGPCDPNSKTCSCLKRQREYWGETGFIYDYRGRLREHDYPIFECNAFCGCEGDCRNRVVQNGRKHAVDIRKTRDKGWGVFAGSKKIPANTFIGIYAGEYLTDEQGEERGTLYNKFGRTYLFDLDFHHLKSDQPDWSPQYCVDAYHAGNFTRYLNHSCDPNCNINPCYINEANMDKPLLTIFTSRDVDAGQELCFSYFGPMDDDDSQEDGAHVHDAVYVPCRCGAKRCRGRMWK